METAMTASPHAAAVSAIGQIEGYRNEVRHIRDSLSAARLWRPSAALVKQCDEVLRIITELEERFERKLVVSIIGSSGSGKSTLMNALAGVDDLSETGHRRPTTQNVVVLCKDVGDTVQLLRELGSEHVKIKTSRAALRLEHMVLIDTPDTDSTEQERHIPVIEKAIEMSDVLICLFNAENPKRRDHVDFMEPYVRRFSGESLLGVINQCDRQDEKELREKILPEFSEYIQAAWNQPLSALLCVSARRHLRNPNWDPQAPPRHHFDQFDQLRQMLFGTFRRPGYIVDRRLENSRSLINYLIDHIKAEVLKDQQALVTARQQLREGEQKALTAAIAALRNNDGKHEIGVNVRLYQKLSLRWMGPVGWVIALWARVLIFGTGIAAIFRFGNPLRQITGIVSSLRHFKESKAAVAETTRGEKIDAALRDYRISIMSTWPDIAELFFKGRFSNSVRKIEDALQDSAALNEELTALWNDAVDDAIEKASQRLSGFFMQVLFNLPVVAILAHAGWITARNYFTGHYLSSDFFLHAFLTVGIALSLCFFLFQACARLIGSPDRISRDAFDQVKRRVEMIHPPSINPAAEQADMVLNLTSLTRVAND
jgi:GTPase SAR1 family protein